MLVLLLDLRSLAKEVQRPSLDRTLVGRCCLIELHDVACLDLSNEIRSTLNKIALLDLFDDLPRICRKKSPGRRLRDREKRHEIDIRLTCSGNKIGDRLTERFVVH